MVRRTMLGRERRWLTADPLDAELASHERMVRRVRKAERLANRIMPWLVTIAGLAILICIDLIVGASLPSLLAGVRP